MKKRLLLLVLLPVLSAVAHHSYGEYDRDKQVAMEGTITHVLWGNPHVVITLQTEDRGEYTVEWAAMFQLSRSGVTTDPFKLGDRIVVTASINRNPEKHILTLIREIKRPADGWRWTDPRYVNAK
jgi:hypothetical protein